MKTIKFSLLLLLTFSTLTFTSCSKDDDTESESATYINFTAEGKTYNFKDIISAESQALTLNGNNGEGITNTGDTQISIFLPVEPETGTFNFEGAFEGEHKLSFSSESLGFDFDFTESGSVTITEITEDYIIGTFTAIITSENDVTITIASGEFKGEIF
ncbi:MAG: hypothetical protein ABJJ05_06775 [Maribacter litoralis]|uniref:hypothetical protein n=1 Tax=Maribacter litoralis TaxID=2059726 RepID=UPI0032989F28